MTSWPFECLVLASPDNLSDFLEMIEISIVLAMNLGDEHTTRGKSALVPRG